MSYKLVLIEKSGRECGNACRFATAKEATDSFYELAMRWMGCPLEHRVDVSESPANYAMVDGLPSSLDGDA